jgi:hypothetical protein
MLTSSYLFLNLLLFFLVMVLILGFYSIQRLRSKRKNVLEGHFPDPRFRGSTAFLVGESGLYRGAVLPIPMEGVTIGSDVNEANIIISDQGIHSRHVFITFPVGEYHSIIIKDLGGEAGTYYILSSDQENWKRLQGSMRFSIESPGKIRVGTNLEIFDITFRL